MNELDDHREFLAGLPDPKKPPARTRQVPKPVNPTEIDPAAAHLAAAFTELKVSVQRLHTDLAQRMRVMEAKVDGVEAKVEAGVPDWRTLAAQILRASERGGQDAAAHALALNDSLTTEVRSVVEVRSEDIRLFRNVVWWVVLPLFVLGLFVLLKAGHDAEKLPQNWFIMAAFALGAGTVLLGLNLKSKWAEWRSERQYKRDQKTLARW